MTKLLVRYLKPYIPGFLIVLLATATQVYCELSLPNLMADIVDTGLTTGGIPYILSHGLLMLLMSLGQVAAMIAVGFLSSKISSAMGMDLRHDIFVKAETLSLEEMNDFTVSSMIVRNTNDVTVIQNLSTMLMRMVLSCPVLCIGSIVIAFRINVKLARIVLAAVPVLVAFFTTIIFFGSKYFVLYRKKLDSLNLLIREHLSGTRVIRAFVNQETESKKFEAGNTEIYHIGVKINRIVSSLRPGMMLIINLSTVAVCYFGVGRIREGSLLVGELMSFIAYVTHILMSLSMLSFLMVVVPRAKVSAKRINDVLNKTSSIQDYERPKTPSEDYIGTIEFKNVSLCYKGSSYPAIDNVSFKVEKGKTTAIIGSTGCGKSTLIKLILRLHDVTSGQVLVEGIDVRDFDLKDLRNRIGFVPQKAVLFSGTVAENIRFGFPKATDEEIEKALEIAQAWDFVSEKDEKINFVISQGGKNVSGGQKQRIAIARAIIKPCNIYIFDDSFSALDYATDSRLRMALASDERLKNSTRLIIAQRISTVMNADKIIVFDNGKVAGEGKHKDLLASCPLYYEIASSQLSEEEFQ